MASTGMEQNTYAPSSPFERFIAPAAPKGSWWRVLIGLGIIVLCWLGWSILLVSVLGAGLLAPFGLDSAALDGLTNGIRASSPAGVMVFMMTFWGLWIGLWVATRLMHRRPFRTLFHPEKRGAWADFGKGVLLILAFHAIGMTAYILTDGPPARSDLPLNIWAVWLVPMVLAIMIQATSEELLFRGYILQHFAQWSRNPIIWAVVPGLVFTAIHYDESIPSGVMLHILFHIFLFSIIAAAAVWRTGNLWMAAGIHVANNIFAIGVVSMEGYGLGFELFLFPIDILERMFVFDVLTSLIALIIVLKMPLKRGVS